MTPEELRAFRESLGMTRKEFAPGLLISEPTLERWERGQGGPRETHVQILRRMRENAAGSRSMGYFEYDAGACPPPPGLLDGQKQFIIEALSGEGMVPLKNGAAQEGADWSMRFSPGWATGQPVNLTLVCEGSERKERPFVDFTLRGGSDGGNASAAPDLLEDVCFDHAVSPKMVGGSGEQLVLQLRQRLFTPALNADAIRHVVGNLESCWRRLAADLVGFAKEREPERKPDAEHSPISTGTP